MRLVQIDKVDIDYFRKSKRFDMSDETRVHADASSTKEYEAQDVSNSRECFHLNFV